MSSAQLSSARLSFSVCMMTDSAASLSSSPLLLHKLHLHPHSTTSIDLPSNMPAPYSAAAALSGSTLHHRRTDGCCSSRCGDHDATVPREVARHHDHAPPSPGQQCCSAVVQRVAAPAGEVWSVVRRFDMPQAYKSFVRSCALLQGDGGVGTLREVRVVSGLPAASSRERLEILDEERHVLSFLVVGGEHRLRNYRSVTTVSSSGSGSGAVVVESYVVDVPPGNTPEDTRVFADTIVKCNLQSLARTAEKLAAGGSRA